MTKAFFPALVAAWLLMMPASAAGPIPIRFRLALRPVTLSASGLPISRQAPPILAFRAARKDRRVLVQWRTSTQHCAFTVQRALDGIYWLDLTHLTVDSVANRKTRSLSFEEEWTPGGSYRVVAAGPAHPVSYSPVRWVKAAPYHAALTARQLPRTKLVLIQGADPSQPLQLISGAGYPVLEVTAPTFSCADLLPGTYALRQGQRLARLIVR